MATQFELTWIPQPKAAFCPNFDWRYRNVTFWGRAAVKKGIEGVISLRPQAAPPGRATPR